ncbi:SRPBCC domain-containing protein, partial [Streptomyces sp. NP-1717]|uniref:SRPBCC domain-containing protein n=1 Tax=Streptomyces sp. NP-1717 TaxID=2704470 RepID=UPI0024141172
MEHEVFIPVPAETLREALRDHARVARCVPGLQQDADASARPLSGRLKVRVGGHTITYRGALTLTERAGAFTAKGEGAEIRGTGSAGLNVRIRLRDADGGTTVAFTATSTSEGRLSDIAPTTSEAAARRLLDRFATALGASGGEAQDESAAGRAGAGGPAS